MGGPPSQDEARAAYGEAFDRARAADDVDGMAAAALGLASLQRFGNPAGRAPVVLHEAYVAAAGLPATRARLAAALARSWVYGNDAHRGVPFATEAVALADDLAEPRVLADALDAQLATSWGPDDLAARLHITARLQEVAAHVDDVRTRMDAHLWRLTTALETLDVVGVNRQLAALDLLADETGSPLARYFALTRRCTLALLTGDLDRARELMAMTDPLGLDADIPDAYAVHHSQLAELARQTHDVELLRTEVETFEEYAVGFGIQSLHAESAVLWLEAGNVERAARIILQVAGSGLDTVPRDVDWMLTVTKVVDAAAGTGLVDLAREGMTLLAPYAGRAVVNAGAVNCQGVVEDYLWRAAVLVGDRRADDWRAAAAAAYRRLDAPWWLARVRPTAPSAAPAQPTAARRIHLHPVPGQAVWSVGRADAPRLVPDMKGLHYLRALVQRPGLDISALDLSASVAGHHTPVAQADVGERLDRRALAAYRQRLRDIDEELDEAREWSDAGRVERLEAERDALLGEIAAATGLHGRARTEGGSAERARVAVRKAIAAALDRIDADDPGTARLLRTCVRTGSACRYEPDPDAPVEWDL